jgi:hypothetical protein
MRTGGAPALLSLAPGPVFDAGRHRTGAVGARASAGAQLRVEDVEGVGGDLRNVDVVQRTQVAGDNPPVLLQGVGRPAPLLYVKPLRSQVAERASARDRIAVSQLDGPAVAFAASSPIVWTETRGVYGTFYGMCRRRTVLSTAASASCAASAAGLAMRPVVARRGQFRHPIVLRVAVWSAWR